MKINKELRELINLLGQSTYNKTERKKIARQLIDNNGKIDLELYQWCDMGSGSRTFNDVVKK